MNAILPEAKGKPVLFAIPSLAGGGAERVMVTLLRHLDREKFQPVLALFESKGPYLADLPNDVRVYDLGKRSRWDFPWLVWRLARAIRRERPAAVVSFLWYANVVTLLAAALARHRRVIVSERNTSGAELRGQRLWWAKRLLVRWLYRRAAKIIAVSGGVRDDLVRTYSLPPSRIDVIYNPIDLRRIQELAAEPVNDLPLLYQGAPVIIAVGRLEPQKGYHFLLRAFSQVRKVLPARLLILGEGSLRRELEMLAEQLGVGADVVFRGFDPNPYKYMQKASVFVLCSLYEGFPNVLLEAMAGGVPVVATDCRSGPNEIITDGVNGLLVPVGDAKALARAICAALEDRALAARLAANGRARANDFDVRKVVAQWEELLAGDV